MLIGSQDFRFLPIPAHLPSDFINSSFCLNEYNTFVLFLCHYFFQQCAKPAMKLKKKKTFLTLSS